MQKGPLWLLHIGALQCFGVFPHSSELKALGGNAREQRDFPAESSPRSASSAPPRLLTHRNVLKGEILHPGSDTQA